MATRKHEANGPLQAGQMEALKKIRVVIRAAARHSSWIEKQCGVPGAQLWVMKELHQQPGLRVGEVAQRLSIHQTTTSNLVDALVKQGLVMKKRAEHDQRVVELKLSRKGKSIVERAPEPARGLLPEALRKMDARDLARLNKGLDALLAIMGGEGDEALLPLPFTL